MALVDDEHYDFLMQWKWRACRAKRKQTPNAFYAIRTTPRPNRKCIAMHREVLRLSGFLDFPQCDHIDSNGLNNQRSNLRPATASQNRWNMRKREGRTSKYKGVYWHKKTRKWMARIGHLYKHKYLGNFTNEIDAAKAYDSAAIKLFGEFAFLNLR